MTFCIFLTYPLFVLTMHQILRKLKHNNAVCHVAHKLTRVIFHMLKENVEFKEQLEN